MNWYYVDAGQQAGPVDETQLAELVRTGRIQPETLVWHEGMANWQPYRDAAPAPTGTPGVPPVLSGTGAGTVQCSECGRSFAPDEVIRYGNQWVCAACKPTFFQRLSEGAALPGGGPGATATEADLLARDYEVDIGGALSRSWEMFKANAGILIGASVLVYLAVIAANIIPYLSLVLGLLLNGPLMAGLWVLYIRKVRNQDVTVGDAFSGFGPRFWQLVLTQLIPGLISGAIAGLLVAVAVIPALVLSKHHGAGSGGMSAAMIAIIVIAVLAAIVIFTYLSICWIFALALAGDKGLKFWPALELSRRVVMKHWWMTLWLAVVCGFVTMLGALACGFGMLVTGPVAFGALAVHYEKVFGDLAPEA